MVEQHARSGAAATLAVEAVPHERVRHHTLVLPAPGSSPLVGTFDVAEIPEKPRPDEAQSHWAAAARFVFNPAIFEAIRCTRPARSGELQLMDALRMLLRQGERVQAVCLSADQRHHDIGNFGGYFRAFLDFALSDDSFGDELRTYMTELLARRAGHGDEE
jgi:UTP--glucose-1-phosphate uridylyltransferase